MAVSAHADAGCGKRPAGFTLLEMVAVLVLLGILTAVAVGRMGDNPGRVAATAGTLKVHLRHAQFRAMYSETTWGVHSTGGGYWLFFGGDTNNKALFPGENLETVTPATGVTIPAFTVSFDDWGAPHNVVDPATAPPLASSLGIVVSSGTSPVTITITPNTGFIP
jgi:MSHA pilin protein MshC